MNWNTKETKMLIEAFLALETPQEVKDFLRDILTEKEIVEISKRLQVADMLSRNTSYTEIEQKTGFSSTTVARVSKWLTTGTGGYKNILNKIHHHTPTKLTRGLS